MKLALSFLLAATLSTPLASLAAESHDHGAAASHHIELNAGKKWATDAPLRKAMKEIKVSVDRTLPAAHAGKAQAADFDAFGQAVTAQIGYIVENCKLRLITMPSAKTSIPRSPTSCRTASSIPRQTSSCIS